MNRSKVYVSGTEFGLSLIERDPLNVQALPRSVPAKPDATSTARSSTAAGRSSLLRSNLSLPSASPVVPPPVEAVSQAPVQRCLHRRLRIRRPPTPPTQADADRLNEKYQSQLAALGEGRRNEISFCRLRPAYVRGFPRSNSAPDDPAKFHPVRACERLDLQKCRAELRPVPGPSAQRFIR